MGILRLLLALSVVIEHSGPVAGFTLVGGRCAVQAFYIISGFYMSLILNEKYILKNDSYRLFITSRFIRLFPVYWTVLLFTLVFSTTVFLRNHTGIFAIYQAHYAHMGLSSLLFLSLTNIFLFGQDLVMFLGLSPATGHLFFTENFNNTNPTLHSFLFIPQAWTIGVELTFYLIAPFLVRRSPKVISALFLGSILLRAALYRTGLNHDPWNYRFFPTEAAFFLLGNLSYRVYTKIKDVRIKPIYLDLNLMLILLFIFSYGWISFDKKSYLFFVFFAASLPFIFKHTKFWKRDTAIGELSYPIYIAHLFVLLILREFNVGGSLGMKLIIATVLISILLNETVAKRIEKIRQARILRHSL